MIEDYDYEDLYDRVCLKCGEDTRRADCDYCGGRGFHDDLYERDPLWYDEDDTEDCDFCDGRGFHWWCPTCGYDQYEDPEGLREQEI